MTGHGSHSGKYSGLIASLALALAVLQPGASLAGTTRCPAPSPPAVAWSGNVCIIPVTTIIENADSNSRTVDIGNDGNPTYLHNTDGVSSFLTSNSYNGLPYGDWQFRAMNSPRMVGLGFELNDAIQPGEPGAQSPFVAANPPYWWDTSTPMPTWPGHVQVKCTLMPNPDVPGGYSNMLAMKAGDQITCPLVDGFTIGADTWTLQPALSFTHYPETTDVQIRCNKTDSYGCSDWFIDPINLGEAVGRLVDTIPLSKGKSQTINDGDFYMRFHIHITRP